jgi:hypothetical protein
VVDSSSLLECKLTACSAECEQAGFLCDANLFLALFFFLLESSAESSSVSTFRRTFEMAQWIPKTAGVTNNINKRYGHAFLGLINKRTAPGPPNFFSSTQQPQRYVLEEFQNSRCYSAGELAAKYFTEQRPFLDLRDEPEKVFEPLSRAAPMHHHDLLSGAAVPILPADKNSEIFVVASSRQRGVNGFNALVRWGYKNIVVVDYASLKGIEESRGKEGGATRPKA